jgi:hypothetical protein
MNVELRYTFRSILFFLSFILSCHFSEAQHIKLTCTEKELKNGNAQDPILVKTCYIKNFKFVEVSRPDYTGRYDSEYKLFVRVNNKYQRTVNSSLFNKDQGKLVSIINERIQKEYKDDLADTSINDCFDGLDSIPTYKMNDFKISFYENKIWFIVDWGLSGYCRGVDGAIITFEIAEIEKYLK